MPQLTVSPSRPSLDTPLHIRAAGLPPGATVRITAREQLWRSWATFVADRDGTVDLHRDAPVDGTYRKPDPMGLIWSMLPTDEPSTSALELALDDISPTSVERLRLPDGVEVRDVHEEGLVGVLCRPSGPGPWPGVIMLGGAEGGLHADDAALLAGHGFVVLALAYFGLPGLPPTALNVPLEYFGTALDFLAGHADRLGVVGGSKGGEAALLLAATFPQVRAVVSVCGSGVLTQGIAPARSFLDIMRTPVANWTHRDRPLAYLPNVVTPELVAQVEAGEPIRLQSVFTPGLLLRESLAAATIPIERTDAAVLLISSTDDAGYGPEFHAIAADRLRNHRRPWRHVVHPEAGHGIIAPPFLPTTNSLSPGPGIMFDMGGTPEADAVARELSWTSTVDFLAEHLR
jgi:dienelactone hydrolase